MAGMQSASMMLIFPSGSQVKDGAQVDGFRCPDLEEFGLSPRHGFRLAPARSGTGLLGCQELEETLFADVEHALGRDPQFRDDRQGQERERAERGLEGAAQGVGRVVHLVELAADGVGVLEREQPGDGQRQQGPHRPARGGDEAAAVLGQRPGAGEHVAGVGAGDDQVVRIVGDRRAEGAVMRQAEAADQPQADPARGPVPLDAGDQQRRRAPGRTPSGRRPGGRSATCAG